MRVVLNTNTVISGILWGNQPRQILDLAKADKIKLYTSKVLLDELLDVLSRPKFAKRLISVVQSTPQEILSGYAALAQIVEVQKVEKVIENDSDDDHVLACAIAAQIDYIISGDKDLLVLGIYQNIPIVNAAQFINLL
jgi:putative PIN family toxin of toxin-antitoxin system